MKTKQKVELIIATFLILCGSILLIFPLFHFVEVKIIFITVMGVYALLNLIKFILIRKTKDYEGLFTSLASLIVLTIALFLDISKVPWYLALTLFIWISLMSIIKLKKADYYNDRKNGIWILEIVCLILFILSGLLSTINLYYENDIQVLVLGYFYLIHGILEIIDPLVIHLNGSK
ncbi:MAG: hypothetical protein ACLUFU_05380 [Bacilli bacterium]